jgi:hypothetical protein
MTISSSSGGEMGEFINRVSDIFVSPVISSIWQFNYRQAVRVCLIFSLIACLTLSASAEEKISRFKFVEIVYERVFNQDITEMEAVQSGLLEAYDDGSYHLDWPISRGMAAEAFYKLVKQSGGAEKAARAFSDVKPDSRFRKSLNVVGAAFLPRSRGKFDPNHILGKKDLFHALRSLIDKEVIVQIDRSDSPVEILEDPVSTKSDPLEEISNIEVRPELGFKEKEITGTEFRRKATRRFGKAYKGVTSQQLNPQVMSNIENAAEAMKDVEKLMEALGGNIVELSASYPENEQDKADLKRALAKIEKILTGILERFNYSKVQLNSVIPVDPAQIRKCSLLNDRLEANIKRATELRNRINSRLAEKD